MPAADCPKCGGRNTCEIVYGPVASQEEYDLLVAYYAFGIEFPPVVHPVDRGMRGSLATCSGYGLRFPPTVPPEYNVRDPPRTASLEHCKFSSIVQLVDREEHDRLAAEKRIHLGGSNVSPTSPALYCNDCQNRWGLYCPKCGSSDTCQIVYRHDAGAKDSRPAPYVVLEPGPITYGSPADEAEYDRLVAQKKIRPGKLSPSSFFNRPASTDTAEGEGAFDAADRALEDAPDFKHESVREGDSAKLAPELPDPGLLPSDIFARWTSDPARHCNRCGNEWSPYCPNCHSDDLCMTIHGYVILDDCGEKLIDKKKIELGGCCSMDIFPDWKCNKCKTTWFHHEEDDDSDEDDSIEKRLGVYR